MQLNYLLLMLYGHKGVNKETRSVTMNIFRKNNLFKAFVKIELIYVFTIDMFSRPETCTEKGIIL